MIVFKFQYTNRMLQIKICCVDVDIQLSLIILSNNYKKATKYRKQSKRSAGVQKKLLTAENLEYQWNREEQKIRKNGQNKTSV